ncbi:MAG: acetolactate synthase small subunit [Clostridiales bacterium]|nr:acetolactate synthase small subunit [Clostridiales bacterium]
MKKGQFILGVIVTNHFGVLTRVSGLFSRRGYNIDSLNVGETEDPTLSRMTIIVTGDDYIESQIVKQLSKLQDVKKVELLPADEAVIREHLLIKVRVTNETRTQITEAVNIFRAKVIDFTAEAMTVEVTGETTKLDAFIEYVKNFGIIEMCRAGALAVYRGTKSL